MWPAVSSSPLRCDIVAGQSQHVTIDGAQALLRTIDEPGKHWQSLCAPDVDSLSLLIELDLNIPGTNDTPLPGGSRVGGLLTVFSHLRLLGPDVANWTKQPLR